MKPTSRPFKIKNPKFIILLVLLFSTQLFHCPAVKYNNPTDGGNGLGMQLMDTLTTTLTGVNVPELKVVLTGNPSAITEGQTATVQMKLSRAITSNLVVTLTLDNPILTIEGTATKEFTFTPDNATVEQSFILAALSDENSISETVNLKVTAVGLKEESYSISTIDNTVEIIQTVIFTGLPSTITEGQTANVQVKLVKAITSPITVVLTLDNSAVSIDGFAFKILTFGHGNETTDQTITLSAVSDANSISETVNLKVSATGLTDNTFSISTIDNTVEVVQAVVFTGLPSVITEGQFVNVRVKLTKPITTSLNVNLTLDNPAITIDSGSSKELTFTTENATLDQTVTLTAVSDKNMSAETVTLKASASGLQDQTLTITTVDTTPPPPVITISNVPASVTEGTTVSGIGVKLSGTVTSSYVLVISNSNSASIVANPSALIFTTSNYTIDQNVSLTALQDANLANESVTFTISGDGVEPVSFTVSSIEDDTQNISIAGVTTLNEGQSGTISISLTNQPTSNVVVSLSSSNTNALTLGASSLTFTSANYNTPQVVTVNALEDSNRLSDTVTITATSTGILNKTWNIQTVEYPSVTVTGLTGSLTLVNNGTDEITVTGNGTFKFNAPNTVYNVIGKNYLTGVNCPISNGVGNNSTLESNVNINCVGTYTTGEHALGLIKTGQTRNYFGNDDGYEQKTLSKTYKDNGNGTVTDYVTGLIWQKCSMGTNNDATCSGAPTIVNAGLAVNYCNTLSLASKTWRLPTIKELSTLIDLGKYNPSIDSTVFPNTGLYLHWSSNIGGAAGWTLSFIDGYGILFGNSTALYVRCVSGGTTAPIPIYTDLGNSTIKDNRTGLIWQKCTMGQTTPNCTGGFGYMTWLSANEYCKNLNLAPPRTWRLPNRNELQSLIDYSKSTIPTIDTTFFPNTQDKYWSSSTYANNTGLAWIVNFAFVDMAPIDKSASSSPNNMYKIRCVSGP